MWGVIEPVMLVEITIPNEFTSQVQASLAQRKAVMLGHDTIDDFTTLFCEVRHARPRQLRRLHHALL